jgi:hypothetical protein
MSKNVVIGACVDVVTGFIAKQTDCAWVWHINQGRICIGPTRSPLIKALWVQKLLPLYSGDRKLQGEPYCYLPGSHPSAHFLDGFRGDRNEWMLQNITALEWGHLVALHPRKA